MNDVVLASLERSSQLSSQTEPDCNSRLRAVAIDRLAAPKPNDVRLRLRTRNVGGDDVDVMAAPPRFAREEVHMLADATEMRIVVLGDERNAKRAVVPNDRQVR